MDDVELEQLQAICALARADALAAVNALTNIRACIEALVAIRSTDNPLLQSVLLTGLAVTYYRAFEEVTEDTKNLRRRFSFRAAKGADKVLHQALQKLRGDHLAHSKQDVNDIEVSFLKQTLTSTPLNGDQARRIVTGGSQARASMPIIEDGGAADKLQLHLECIRDAAELQLAECLFRHETTMVARLQAGDKPKVKFTMNDTLALKGGTRTVFSNRPEALVVRATAPEALDLKFVTLRYWLSADAAGVMALNEALNAGHGAVLRPAVQIIPP